ncbi:MAG: hypothetical protein ACRDI2_14265, partial [Chloroflexota bacterium]
MMASRHGRRTALALALTPALAACGQGAGGQGSNAQGRAPSGQSAGTRIDVAVPGTDLAVGPNRFSLGVLRITKGKPDVERVTDAQLSLRFFHPIQPQPVLKGEAVPEFRYVGDESKGLYIAHMQFDQAGAWGVEVTGTSAGQPLPVARVQFEVKPKPDTPAIGSPAPRSHNLTRHDVDDIRKIDSGATPNDMHELTIADAIEAGKPLVVLFASPGFCVTQTCAPELGEVQQLKAKYGQQANFIHIEIFKDPMTRTPYETVTEWGLTSEPWVFLVD